MSSGFIVLGIIGYLVFYLMDRNEKKRVYRETSEQLWNAYQDCLGGCDKRAALAAGRAYYSFVRGAGGITIYDEAAIQNDLLAMKTIEDK